MSTETISIQIPTDAFATLTQLLSDLKTGLKELLAPLNDIKKALTDISKSGGIDGLAQQFSNLFGATSVFGGLIGGILVALGVVSGPIGALIGTAIAIASAGIIMLTENWDSIEAYLWEHAGGLMSGLSESWNSTGEAMKGVWDDVMSTIDTIWSTVGEPILTWVGTTFENLCAIANNLWVTVLEPIFTKVGEVSKDVWDNTLQPIFEKVGIAIGKVTELFLIIWNQFIAPFVQYLIDVFGPVIAAIINTVIDVFSNMFQGIGNVIQGIIDVFTGIIDFFCGIFTGDWKRALSGLINIFVGFGNMLISVFENVVNGVIVLINGLISLVWSGIKALINMILGGLEGIVGLLGIDLNIQLKGDAFQIGKVNIQRLSAVTLATGGFPATGQMFVAREAGPELVGTIGSRSAVVNNSQIVDSVSAGVYRAVREAMGSQSSGGVLQLIMDGTKVAEVVSDNVNAITRRTGRCPILV